MSTELDGLNESVARVTEAASHLAAAFADAGKSIAAACHVLNAAQLARDEAMFRIMQTNRDRLVAREVGARPLDQEGPKP